MFDLDSFTADQLAEWGTWVAARPIQVDGALAFNEGDPVPCSHIERGVVDPDDVIPTTTTSEED